MKKQIFIFDLDDTVIDSSHRATLKAAEEMQPEKKVNIYFRFR